MSIDERKPMRGDMVLTQGRGIMADAIRHCQRNCEQNYTPWEAEWTHVGIVQSWGSLSPNVKTRRVIEARGFGVTKRWYDNCQDRHVVLRYVTHIPSTGQREEIVSYADSRVGNKYAWWQIIYMYFLHLWHRLQHTAFDQDNGDFCAEVAANAYQYAGLPLPTDVPPWRLWPAEIAHLWRIGALEAVYDSAEISGDFVTSAVH